MNSLMWFQLNTQTALNSHLRFFKVKFFSSVIVDAMVFMYNWISYQRNYSIETLFDMYNFVEKKSIFANVLLLQAFRVMLLEP